MDDCVALAKDVGAAVAERFGVPVYLYEEASANPGAQEPRRHPPRRVRGAGGEDGVSRAGRRTSARARRTRPPAPRSIGARMPLIAYNINLHTDRLDVAKKIAAAIRHSSGGFRYVKAMGFELEDRGIVQVSMNLTNYEKTPIFRVFEMVKREAERYGVSILESEIVGLVPSAALSRPPSTTCRSTGSTRPGSREQAAQLTGSRIETSTNSDLRRSRQTTLLFLARAGAMPNALILRYRLLRSTPSASAVREMLPCCAASARRM